MRKHITAALLISPILALIAYFGIDQLVREEPHRIQEGAHYKLNVKPNCRWESGRCTLVNADIELSLSYERRVVTIESATPVEQILVAVAQDQQGGGTAPGEATTADNEVFHYEAGVLDPGWFLQLSALVEGAWFHALVPLTFTGESDSKLP